MKLLERAGDLKEKGATEMMMTIALKHEFPESPDEEIRQAVDTATWYSGEDYKEDTCGVYS